MVRKRTRNLMVMLVAAVVSTGLLPAIPAQADTPAGSASLSVSPPTYELDATPGQNASEKIGLDNLSDEKRTITIQVQNFAAQGEEGQAALTEGEGPYSLSQWIKVTPDKVDIPPRGHQDFQVQINVPSNAPPGGHFGALVFSPSTGGASGGASLSVVSQVTSLILLRVPGNTTEKASIAGFNICKPKAGATLCDQSNGFLQKGPITMSLRVQNQGNVQVQPEGTVTVYNMFGSKVATLPIAPHNVLPDSVRRFDVQWKHGTLFGIYKAKVDLKYGTDPQSLRVEKSFYVAPVATLVGALIGIVLLFLLFWLPRKRIRKAFKALASSSD